jgi:quercetin 2,3-dioxygenase
MKAKLRLIASKEPVGGAVEIHQDVRLYASILAAGETVRHELKRGRYAWVQVARVTVRVNGLELEAGDGAAMSEEAGVSLEGMNEAEVLVFDLA